MERTYIADTKNKIGEAVQISGWVSVRRDHGKLIFLDIRDRSGIVQVVFSPKTNGYKLAQKFRSEWVLSITGLVQSRPEAMVNKETETGEIEIVPESVEVLSEAKTSPIPLDTDGYEIDEETRMKYRYLDLRRSRLQKNIKLRSEFVDKVRQFLFKKGFLEIETPILSKTTPEGSRDFVVPSRLQAGKFYALPQSPQQYKQLLMVAGFEKYFQIARCFRDEDLRADRGFEHTQVDMEVSFLNQEEFMALDEKMITYVVESMGYKIKEKPFPVFTYNEAIEKFGADKFDLRTEEDKKNGVLAYAWVKDFPFFEKDKEGRWTFTHNPFSMPKSEHTEWVLKGKNIKEILTSQYDLVCNGVEVGGGSIRAHKPEILRATFKIMGYSDEEIEKDFGHILEAFSYGVPPHGGIAHGVERNLMTLLREEYLREVAAFPQTSSGKTSVMDAPSELSKEQLAELNLKIDEKK
ncbi:MAG TPA: aspartate--tRNA ligase [Candidatus Paceibacterota bacterium]